MRIHLRFWQVRVIEKPRHPWCVALTDHLVAYREECKLACEDFGSPVDGTPEGSTAAQTPTTSSRAQDAPTHGGNAFPFRVNSNVNRRLYVFDGDICTLRTDCIMCFTTDGLSGSDELASRLLARKAINNCLGLFRSPWFTLRIQSM